jgi:uncharacterized protein YgbK (DUF1537 family)
MAIAGKTLKFSEILSALPPSPETSLIGEIRGQVERNGKKIVMLDDDPTGTQTVYDTPVLTDWSISSLTQIFAEPGLLFCILTNSRSLSAEVASRLMIEIIQNLDEVSAQLGIGYVLISRSDSTLRGHFDEETTAIMDTIGHPIDGVILVPFFEEGGRYTLNDVQYVREGDALIPVSETEFAGDKTFGYHSSNLREWVQEKTRMRISPSEVCSISLEDLRLDGLERVTAKLLALRQRQVCIVNVVNYTDLEILVLSLLKAEEEGRHFLYRTAASFVRVRAGLPPQGLWNPEKLIGKPALSGGLIVAGSHVQKSTLQLKMLMKLNNLFSIEVVVDRLLIPDERAGVIKATAAAADAHLLQGEDVLIFTSRQLISSDQPEESLRIGQAVSSALVDIVGLVQTRPAWIVTKGGITSSDIATRALGIRRASVLGQIEQGVPVWLTPTTSRWKNLILVIFPGNVGDIDALTRTVEKLRFRQ